MSQAQRRKIAQGKVAGATSKEIAAATGLAEGTVRNAVSDPRTQVLISRYKQRFDDQLQVLFADTIKSIHKRVRSESPMVAEPACDQALKLIQAGDQPAAKVDVQQLQLQAQQKGSANLSELLLSIRQTTITTEGQS